MNNTSKKNKLYAVIGILIGIIISLVVIIVLSFNVVNNKQENNSNDIHNEIKEEKEEKEEIKSETTDKKQDEKEESVLEDVKDKKEETKEEDEENNKEENIKEEINNGNNNGAKYSYDLSKLYWTNLNKKVKPRKLFVIVFKYKGNPYYTESDSEIEKMWSDYIFGSGTIKNKTASVNDYLKENSNGKFYYEPVLLGNNKTGVYVVNLDKSYSDAQFIHPEYQHHEFKYDIAKSMDGFIQKGLNINNFKGNGINNKNYEKLLMEFYDANQSFRNPQWYDTDNVMAIFPPLNTESVSFTPLSSEFDSFGLYTHINYTSSFGTIAHELVHTLGAIDIYNFGQYGSDLMSSYYPYVESDYDTMHINPYYKLLFGWVESKILENSATVTLYPATSKKYNPIIVKTKDNNQYYIIENRKAESFDHGINIDSSEGINIWRVDKLSMEQIYKSKRKGLSVDKLISKNDSVELKYYKNYTDANDNSEILSGVKVQLINKNSDGSIEVRIEQ